MTAIDCAAYWTAEELGPGGLALTLLPNAGAAEVLPVRDVAMDGAIIYSCSTTESSFGWLRKRRLPMVLVDEPSGGDLDAYSRVNVDDRAGRASRPPTSSRSGTGGSRCSPWVPLTHSLAADVLASPPSSGAGAGRARRGGLRRLAARACASSPPLTTVAQDVVAKATLAAEELIKAVRRRRAGEPDRVRRHLLPTELVVRGTTGPA